MNALAEDMLRSGGTAVSEFLQLIHFPGPVSRQPLDVANCLVLVEQSFSDFGDLDLLLLVTTNSGRKVSVLIEAKVSTDTDSWVTVRDRWETFLRIVELGAGDSSNLFVQLHRKTRLVDWLRGGRAAFLTDGLVPRGSESRNQVVLRACRELRQHLGDGDVYFVALLPDDPDSLHEFFAESFQLGPTDDSLRTWAPSNWAYLSWHSIAGSLTSDSWSRTKAALAWNEGQIFRTEPPPQQMTEPGQVYLRNDRFVVVVDAGKGRQCRVAYVDEFPRTNYWATTLVFHRELLPASEVPSSLELPFLPRTGAVYEWNPNAYADAAATSDISLEQGEKLVVQGRPRWLNTRVKLANGSRHEPFIVSTHGLRRSGSDT